MEISMMETDDNKIILQKTRDKMSAREALAEIYDISSAEIKEIPRAEAQKWAFRCPADAWDLFALWFWAYTRSRPLCISLTAPGLIS
jgi:hypothetical protein